jgi:hypothetical protein
MSPVSYPIRRNPILLAAGLTASGGVVQVAVAVGTTTLVVVTGVESIVGRPGAYNRLQLVAPRAHHWNRRTGRLAAV